METKYGGAIHKQESVHSIIRKAITQYTAGSIAIGQYVQFSMYETIERITAYLNSKHTSGQFDSLGREKPFFNIIIAAVNIWTRATDLDTKDVVIRPTKMQDTIAAFLATVLLQDWMRRERFGAFLNQWGRTLASYGSAVVKFVERNGTLIPSVVPWNRLVVDARDFNALPRIEKLYKTPAQLYQMPELDPQKVDALCNAFVTSRKDIRGQQIDNMSEFIELYEVHGDLSRATYNKAKNLPVSDEDYDVYFPQMHIVSYVKSSDGKNYDDFTLYCGKETKDPYMITHLFEEDGRTLGIGAVEYLFDAQWMQNHTVKNMKDALDIASRLIFQTADTHFVGRNVLAQIESGDIMIHEVNMPLGKIDTAKPDIVSLEQFSALWKTNADELVSTPPIMKGMITAGKTNYRAQALASQQAQALFEIMAQNKGIALEDMLRQFIIPHLKKKLSHNEEIMTLLADHDLRKVDALYIPNEAIRRYNEQAKEQVLSGAIPSPYVSSDAEGALKKELSSLGNSRSFKPTVLKDGKDVSVKWTEIFKDLEWDVAVGITNESEDKNAVTQTLSMLMQTIATNPTILQDPNAKLLFAKILNTTGVVSPVELSTVSAAVPQGMSPEMPPGTSPGMPPGTPMGQPASGTSTSSSPPLSLAAPRLGG